MISEFICVVRVRKASRREAQRKRDRWGIGNGESGVGKKPDLSVLIFSEIKYESYIFSFWQILVTSIQVTELGGYAN
ncbi:hypothetical protein [Nostoc piscinale]|uniref:hypothetical protein n=1 Tax=Nostoc piscinale TaxID=224012 RepID=UPI0039A667E6